jgi:hypothetical protein
MNSGRPGISGVFNLYDRALSQTRGRLEDRWIEGTEELKGFYRDFLHHHVKLYAPLFRSESYRAELHRDLGQRFRTSDLRFWAIDGANVSVESSDLLVFYGGAYVVKGELALQDNPPLVSYRESEPEDDSSLVAYLPLSPEDLTIINPEDRFVVSDAELVSTSGIDTLLMLMAEVYLCYRGASGADRPHLILWDHSLSSVLANATPNVTELRIAGAEISGEPIWYPDLLVGYSKPWNTLLDVPSRKSHRLWERAIAKLYESDSKELDLVEFARDAHLPIDKVRSQVKIIWESDRYGNRPGGNPDDALVERVGDALKLRPEYRHSAAKVERLYLHFCNQLFRDKDPSCLVYSYKDSGGNVRERFLSADELSFLLAIGLRLTFESCWKNGVMLVGVVKDSSSSYFTNHYLGVMRHTGQFQFSPKNIPSTDRLAFERIPYIDPAIRAPWGSTEFDAVFMTLRMHRATPGAAPRMEGVRGNVLVQPNLIMKTLVQLYLKNEPPMEPTMGHVIFVDRLIQPAHPPPARVTVIQGDAELGTLSPFVQPLGSVTDRDQEFTVYLLSVLARNVFPDVVGYPDPLHLADRGAKSVLRMVFPMLKSSERVNRADPIHRTLRQNRGG